MRIIKQNQASQNEPQTTIIKDWNIRASGDFRSSPYFLKTRDKEGRLMVVGLANARSPEEARRIAFEKGHEVDTWIQIEKDRRILHKFEGAAPESQLKAFAKRASSSSGLKVA